MRLSLLVLATACGGALAPVSPDLGLAAGACARQDDCADGTLCRPSAVGAATGSCRAPSTLHCANCTSDGDCGGDALCFVAPGDVMRACHVDCSLSWLACPADYRCARVLRGDATAQVCLPSENRCARASGGACQIGETQPCTISNDAGSCTGVRTCAGGQLGPCSAAEPMFLASCGASAPSGCTELPSPAALSTASDCGACGNACPAVSSTTADAACSDPATRTCGISCRGDNYDLDGNPANGCEVADPDPSNHEMASAKSLGSTTCSDSSSQNSFQGQLLSDTRAHANPTVKGFVAAVGAAPHWFSVFSAGGTCTDDYSLTFTTSGGPAVSCYVATIVTDQIQKSVTVTGAGSGTISGGASSYSDNTTIYFKIEKSCTTMELGDADVRFTVSYHL